MPKPARKIWKVVPRSKFQGSIVLGAVSQLVDFVKVTLGPNMRHILVDHGYKTELVDDGATIAEEFELEDEFEDAVAAYVRQSAKRTDDKAGDGTTTTMILLRGLLKEMIASGRPYPEIAREFDAAREELREYFKNIARPIESEDDLRQVALTAMDDERLARLVAETIFEVGKDGAVTIIDHVRNEVVVERVEGFVINRGFINRLSITDTGRQKAVLPSQNFPGAVAVAVHEGVLGTADEIVPILEAADKKGVKNLVIFASNIIGEALMVATIQKIRGAMNVLGVQIPGQGEKVRDWVDDICEVTGAMTAGGERFTVENLGGADRIESDKDDTMIVGGQGTGVDKMVEYLRNKVEELKEDYDKEWLFQRQARLRGGIRMFKVGGATEAEVSQRLKKIEDAVNSCKCAVDEGMVRGAGMALYGLNTSSRIVNSVGKEIAQTILANSDMPHDILDTLGPGDTVNVLTRESGPYLKVGVVDAAKVVRTAFENAMSIAQLLYNCAGIITSKRENHGE